MFGFFKKKSKLDQMKADYKKMLEESYKLSTTDRKASDLKALEAEEFYKEIQKLEAAEKGS